MTIAFQPNAFQLNGFQTSGAVHSVDAFQRCAFQFGAFQTSPCKQDARSGYWRLFYYQLQEEALRKRDEKLQIPEKNPKGSKVVSAKAKRVKKEKSRVDEVVRHKEQNIRKIQLPNKITPVTLQEDTLPYLVQAWRITTELRLALIHHRNILSTTSVSPEAANDEEDIVLLLLAA